MKEILILARKTIAFILFAIFCWLFLHGCASSCSKQIDNGLSEFELMLIGFPACNFDDVYLNPLTKEPVHKYFINRNLQPSEIKGEIAYFNINETFHGIRVHKILIPASTYDVHAIYLEENVSQIKHKLGKIFYLGFYSINDNDLGEKPVLLDDPNRKGWSIMSCSPRDN